MISQIIKKEKIQDPVIVSPDLGGLKRCKEALKYLKKESGRDYELAVLDKTRKVHNEISEMKVLLGNIKNRDLILVDDMIDTGVK